MSDRAVSQDAITAFSFMGTIVDTQVKGNQMKKYVRYVEGLVGKGQLIPIDEIDSMIKQPSEKDLYISIANYTEEHKKKFDETGTIAGITDVTINKLCFDLDSKDNIEQARQDGKVIVQRLQEKGVNKNTDIEYYYSGAKGWTVVVNLDRDISPDKAKYLATQVFGKGLKTLDTTIYNASRILRVPKSKHQISGLYKIQLKPSQFENMSIDEIKTLAKEPGVTKKMNAVKLPDQLLAEKPPVEKKTIVSNTHLDMTNRPRGWKDYKYALLQGHFEGGERHHALLVVAATCRGLGYDRDLALAMCTVAVQKQAERTNTSAFDLGELESNIIDRTVYSATWQGGQFSPQNDAWLATYCERMGFKGNQYERNTTVGIQDAFGQFQNYATSIDELTIKTGIIDLDRKLRMTVGMSVGLLASAGVGKTSIALQILNYMSKQDIQCIFFSYDMFHALVIQKLIQKHKGLTGDEIFARYKAGDMDFHKEVEELLTNEYKNVRFCFESGQTIAQIEETIKIVEDETGRKVKLIVIDYNELVQVDMGDMTASTAHVAQNIRRISSQYNLCALTLLQPNKASGTPADEIKSYLSIKGSGATSQAASVILGISRPGFDPRHPEDDKFMTINCLKNRMGSLFSLDLSWDGLTGTIRTMTIEERRHLGNVRARIEEEKNKQNEDSGGSWS